MENYPDAVHVFNHCYVVKFMNEKLDDKRRKVYRLEKDKNKRKILKRIRYLLLGIWYRHLIETIQDKA